MPPRALRLIPLKCKHKFCFSNVLHKSPLLDKDSLLSCVVTRIFLNRSLFKSPPTVTVSSSGVVKFASGGAKGRAMSVSMTCDDTLQSLVNRNNRVLSCNSSAEIFFISTVVWARAMRVPLSVMSLP